MKVLPLATFLKQFLVGMILCSFFLGGLADLTLAQRVLSEVNGKIQSAETQTTTPACNGAQFNMTGDDSSSGTFGNIRTFTSGSVSVKASGFSRINSNGTWETSYVGRYPSGLGITDRSEGDGSNNRHKVDNIGDRKNYMLFEFSSQVVIDRVFLDAVGEDSDITVWVGNAADPFNNHLTLSDALLTSFAPSEENSAANNSSRWADINAGGEVGNVLVIAASTADQDPEDAFKIKDLDTDCPPSPCQATTIDLTGSTASDGPDGNIRTFTSGVVSVKASGFSRRFDNGLWETAYLGSYSPGSGVTDRGEGDGSNERHKVDNIGDRQNYVLFEFNQDVVIDEAFLDAIGGDSDITVWIGNATNPFNNHITLSDAVLTSFGPDEENTTTSSSPRVANINAAGKVGNVVVIAASVNDSTPDDAFKIHELRLNCAPDRRARVTIIKQVLTTDGTNAAITNFGFTATNFGTPSFTLRDQNVVGPDRRINSNITAFGAANMITITEDLIEGWTLTDAPECVETGGIQNTTVDFGTRQARIIAEPGESITCTFTNSQLQVTAAPVQLNGRALTPYGQGIAGASVVLTNPGTGETTVARTNTFGYYSFNDLQTGTLYVVTINHKRYTFEQNTRWFTLVDDLAGVDFVSQF
jgi:hypothetical protein